MTTTYHPTQIAHFKEILAAAPDAFAMASGKRPANAHPLAEEASLRQIAFAAGALKRPQTSFEADMSVMARGMQTADFGWSVAKSVHQITLSTFGDTADHMGFCGVLEVPNYKPENVFTLDGDLDLQLVRELGPALPVGRAFGDSNGTQVQINTYARSVAITRQAVINDAKGAIAQAIALQGATAARLESRLVAHALESNPLLDDGQPVFTAGDNIVPEALSEYAIGEGMRVLRTQKTSAGLPSDNKARHLIVEPTLEMTARRLLRETGLDDQIGVHVLATLPSGRWYLTADRQACPTICVLRLAGAATPLRVEPKPVSPAADGIGIMVACDTAAAIVRRIGIVCGGTAPVAMPPAPEPEPAPEPAPAP